MRFSPLACLLLLGLSGCDLTGNSSKPPTVATFTIDATLQSNTCGYGGFAAANFFEKTAVIGGYPGGDATFKWQDSSAASGSATAGGTYNFTSTQSVSQGSDPATGNPLCVFARTTQVTFTITPVPVAPQDGGTGDASVADGGATDGGNSSTYTLTGTLTEDIVPTAGTSCAAFLAVNGGSFEALPCRVAYTLSGTAPR